MRIEAEKARLEALHLDETVVAVEVDRQCPQTADAAVDDEVVVGTPERDPDVLFEGPGEVDPVPTLVLIHLQAGHCLHGENLAAPAREGETAARLSISHQTWRSVRSTRASAVSPSRYARETTDATRLGGFDAVR
jgi:hypothetical protein